MPALALIILAVRELDRAARFYRAAFDWEVAVETPVYVELRLPDGQRLGLYRAEGFARNTGQAPLLPEPGGLSGTELYFYPEDLAAAMTRLGAAGARELAPLAARAWGDEAAYFADPDGNVIVLARPTA